MNVFHRASELPAAGRRVCAAIGVFDGVHLGHQQVLRQTLADARRCEGVPVAITFDRHPAGIVAPERAPAMIYPLRRKLATIAAQGLENLLVIPFTLEFSRLNGREFISGLTRDFGRLHGLCVGSEFTFGHQRSGNVALLREMGRELGFAVHGLAAVALDGEPVSSTRIRQAIEKGELNAASQMLGRAYTLSGLVRKGDQLGRQLGFPTANLDVAGLALPPAGVYAVHAACGENEYRAALNIGRRPTLNQPEPRVQVEAHLLDFTGDLYDRELTLTFVRRLREERKFPDLDALKLQIAADVRATRDVFSN